MKDKIRTREETGRIVSREKKAGKKVGFTNGCFDILHLGHVRYLQETKNDCDVLVVGLNSDVSVRRLKGDERPMNAQDSRAEVLAALESVDLVTIFDEDTPEDLIKMLTPDMLFKGGDWKEEEIVGAEHVKGSGGRVKVIPYVEGYSTTKFIEKIKKEESS